MPAIDRGAELPPSAGLPTILGCRERAQAFLAALERQVCLGLGAQVLRVLGAEAHEQPGTQAPSRPEHLHAAPASAPSPSIVLIYGINPGRRSAARRPRARAAGRRARRRRACWRSCVRPRRAGVALRRVSTAELSIATPRGGVHQGVVAELSTNAPATLHDLVTAGQFRGAADCRPRRHRGSAQPRRDSADGRCGRGFGRRPADTSRRASWRDGRESVCRCGVPRPDCGGGEHRACARGVEGGGVWTVGLDGEAKTVYHDVDLTLPTAFVVGAEGERIAASGQGALRLDGGHPDARPRRQPECLGGDRHCTF